MAFSRHHQLDLPHQFPLHDFDTFSDAARSILIDSGKSDAWKEYGGASNLIGWRFRAFIEHKNLLTEVWHDTVKSKGFEGVYLLERTLFQLFVNGVSCIDSTCYALHALASHPALLSLPFGPEEQRNSTPQKTAKELARHPPSAPLGRVINLTLQATQWKTMKEGRDRMSHRSNLPRIVTATVGSAPPPQKAFRFAATTSTAGLDEDIEFLDQLTDWLAQALAGLFQEGLRFAEAGLAHP